MIRLGVLARWTLASALIVASGAACTRGEQSQLGPVSRMNEKEGDAASFSWPYYTSIVAQGDSVAAAWMNQNGQTNRDVTVRKSVDGGKTWSPELLLNAGGYDDTVSVVPSLLVLPGEGKLFSVWQARRNQAGQKFVLARTSSDFGATWGPFHVLNSELQAFLPVTAMSPDGALVVAWTDERNVYRDIYVNRSLDAGESWLPQDVRVSGFERSEAGAPSVAIGAGKKAYLAWEERPHDVGPGRQLHVSSASSDDLGASWSEPHPVNDEELKASPMWPTLVESAGQLTLVWAGGVTGDEGGSWIWLASSTDGGATWSKPTEIYSGRAHPFFQLRAVGSHLYLVWHGSKEKNGGAIWFNASDDGGKTWRSPWDAAQRLDQPGSDPAAALHPRLAVDGDAKLAVTWQEGNLRVRLATSSDGGKTWSGNPITVMSESEGGELRNPQVALSGPAAYVLWERWPDKKKFVRTLADVEKVLPKDVFVRRVELAG